MTVSARFFVSSVERPDGQPAGRVYLGAVCRGAHNREWASATPGGNITMTIRNGAALDQFVQGEEYEVLFRQVEKPRPGDGHPFAPERTAYELGKIAEDPSWADSNPANQCGFCGVYGVLREDGTLDSSVHDSLYGAPPA